MNLNSVLRSFFFLAFASMSLAACGGNGLPTGSSSSSASSQLAPSQSDVEAIAQNQTSSDVRLPDGYSRASDSEISASPAHLAFASASAAAQTVSVTVARDTTVFAGSEDGHIAEVTPFEQREPNRSGGTLSFTVTPHRAFARPIFICFVTREFRFACITASVSAGQSTPSPSPLPTPAPTPAPTPTAAPTGTPAPSFTGNGLFSFSPTSPFQFSSNAISDEKVFVTEGSYQGAFSVTGCSSSDPTATCTPQTNGYKCANATNGMSLFLAGSSYQALPTGGSGPLTCTFTFSDTYGHSAGYTIESFDSTPAPSPPTPAPTEGTFSFVPASPLTLPNGGTANVVPSETSYTGLFSVTGCSTSTAGATCTFLEPGFGGYVCQSATNYITFATTSSNASGPELTADGKPGGSGALSCTFTVSDANGYSAPYTVNTGP